MCLPPFCCLHLHSSENYFSYVYVELQLFFTFLLSSFVFGSDLNDSLYKDSFQSSEGILWKVSFTSQTSRISSGYLS